MAEELGSAGSADVNDAVALASPVPVAAAGVEAVPPAPSDLAPSPADPVPPSRGAEARLFTSNGNSIGYLRLDGYTPSQNSQDADSVSKKMRSEIIAQMQAEKFDPYAKEMGKCSRPEFEPPVDRRSERRRVARAAVVFRSGGGRRVKLVGDHLSDLAPLFARWADRLDVDLRVVATAGEAPWNFYRLPLTDLMVKPGSVCLFLCGQSAYDDRDPDVKLEDAEYPTTPSGAHGLLLDTSSLQPARKSWRSGAEELEWRQAPSELDGPEFPAFANISDEKKVFIGRVDGSFIYTMLYSPTKLVGQPSVQLPGGLKFTPVPPVRVSDPVPPLEHFLDYTLERYEAIVSDYGPEVCGEMTDRSFREYCGDSKRKRERLLTGQMNKISSELKSLGDRMTRLSRDLRDSQKDMAAVRSGAVDGELVAELRKLERLVTDGLYVGFKIRHGSIMGLTSDVVIEHDGAEHALGKFVVSVNKFGNISMQSASRPFPAHPHLREDPSSFCLGTIGSDVAKTIGAERYAAAFTLLREYLGSYNPNDRVTALDICSGARKAPEEVSDEIRDMGYEGVAVPVGASSIPWPSEERGAEKMTLPSPTEIEREYLLKPLSIQAQDSVTLEQGMVEIREKIAESVAVPPEMLSARTAIGMNERFGWKRDSVEKLEKKMSDGGF